MTDHKRPLLQVKDLRVSFRTPAGLLQAVRGVSFHLDRREIVGLVGESGCGKSVTAQSILRLLPQQITSGKIILDGDDLSQKTEKEMESIRGNRIGMVFQDPMTSLNPTMRLGAQISEGLRRHRHLNREAARKAALELLEAVGIPNAEARLDQYPHNLSGGMRQRVIIAIALACRPALLIADEPTTALDVTIQAQILELMKTLNQQGTSLLLITHDLGVVANTCHRVIIMYAGEVMETGSVDQIFYNPQHPYTTALLQAVPRLNSPHAHRLKPIRGTPPDLLHPPSGCPFHTRCKYAMRICEQRSPILDETKPGHRAACWLQAPAAAETLASFTRELV